MGLKVAELIYGFARYIRIVHERGELNFKVSRDGTLIEGIEEALAFQRQKLEFHQKRVDLLERALQETRATQ